jgi:hypothetical protein
LNEITFDTRELDLKYYSKGKKYSLKFNRDFKIDEKVITTNYDRYDSPYARAKKKDKTITFEYNGKKLFLDFENLIREYN